MITLLQGAQKCHRCKISLSAKNSANVLTRVMRSTVAELLLSGDNHVVFFPRSDCSALLDAVPHAVAKNRRLAVKILQFSYVTSIEQYPHGGKARKQNQLSLPIAKIFRKTLLLDNLITQPVQQSCIIAQCSLVTSIISTYATARLFTVTVLDEKKRKKKEKKKKRSSMKCRGDITRGSP